MKMFDALHAEFEAAGYSVRAVSAQEGFAEKLATHKDGPIVLGYPVVEDTTFALTDELIAKGVLLEKTTAKPVLGEYFDKIPGMTDHNLVQPAMVIQDNSGNVVFKWEGTLPEQVEGHPFTRPDPASVLLQAKSACFSADTLRVVHISKFGQ